MSKRIELSREQLKAKIEILIKKAMNRELSIYELVHEWPSIKDGFSIALYIDIENAVYRAMPEFYRHIIVNKEMWENTVEYKMLKLNIDTLDKYFTDPLWARTSRRLLREMKGEKPGIDDAGEG